MEQCQGWHFNVQAPPPTMIEQKGTLLQPLEASFSLSHYQSSTIAALIIEADCSIENGDRIHDPSPADNDEQIHFQRPAFASDGEGAMQESKAMAS